MNSNRPAVTSDNHRRRGYFQWRWCDPPLRLAWVPVIANGNLSNHSYERSQIGRGCGT